jgi:hypothetical protein
MISTLVIGELAVEDQFEPAVADDVAHDLIDVVDPEEKETRQPIA